jgi:hypothetical protein
MLYNIIKGEVLFDYNYQLFPISWTLYALIVIDYRYDTKVFEWRIADVSKSICSYSLRPIETKISNDFPSLAVPLSNFCSTSTTTSKFVKSRKNIIFIMFSYFSSLLIALENVIRKVARGT